MNAASRKIQRIYLLLLSLQTLAASFIWGINTLFLLDAGLTNTEAFAANAFFTLGTLLFEVPTGVVADTWGRRISFVLGTLTLAASTLLYLAMWRWSAPFWGWALASALLGLGFTFFSGAFQAWLVDALTETGYFGDGRTLDPVLARGQIVEGIAMLTGSVAGGAIAQATSLGVPYVMRAVVLALTFAAAWWLMRDLGFERERGKRPLAEARRILSDSVRFGLGNRPARWVMLAAPLTDGITFYVFYAMQPYLLELYGDREAYGIAGIAAAVVAAAQIGGGLLAPYVGRLFRHRTSVLLAGTAASAAMLAVVGLVPRFGVAVSMVVAWGLMFAAMSPVREAYLNSLIPSRQRATVLSFDSALGSAGAAGMQPALGRVADAWSYSASYLCSAAIQVLALPLFALARRERAKEDAIEPTASS